jgi:hypothetical protein
VHMKDGRVVSDRRQTPRIAAPQEGPAS